MIQHGEVSHLVMLVGRKSGLILDWAGWTASYGWMDGDGWVDWHTLDSR